MTKENNDDIYSETQEEFDKRCKDMKEYIKSNPEEFKGCESFVMTRELKKITLYDLIAEEMEIYDDDWHNLVNTTCPIDRIKSIDTTDEYWCLDEDLADVIVWTKKRIYIVCEQESGMIISVDRNPEQGGLK
jgi:hypothetical protein